METTTKKTENAKVVGEVNARKPSMLTMFKTAKSMVARLEEQNANQDIKDKMRDVRDWIRETMLEEL